MDNSNDQNGFRGGQEQPPAWLLNFLTQQLAEQAREQANFVAFQQQMPDQHFADMAALMAAVNPAPHNRMVPSSSNNEAFSNRTSRRVQLSTLEHTLRLLLCPQLPQTHQLSQPPSLFLLD